MRLQSDHGDARLTPTNHYLLPDDNARGRLASASPEPEFDKEFLAWCVSNRDLSQLEFLRRLLEEAADDAVPPLERLKFLAIFAGDLDEFFTVRVSGLKEIAAACATGADVAPVPGELPPAEQLRAIRERLLPMLREARSHLRRGVLPALGAEGIRIEAYDRLTPDEQQTLDDYFDTHIFGLLTPRAIDAAHPFPFIPNLCLNLALTVEPVPEHGITRSLTGGVKPRFAHIEIPRALPRLVPLAGGGERFVLIEDLIAANVDQLFPRMRVSRCHMFRVTRDAETAVREDEAADLLGLVRKPSRERRFGMPVRLEVAADAPGEMVALLIDKLNLAADDVYETAAPLDIAGLLPLYDLNAPELKDASLAPTAPASFARGESVFDRIKRGDVLLHHPFAAYTITDFISEAARDSAVIAIKACVYQTDIDSPVVRALADAASRGKQVTALVESRTRFDGERDMDCADQLAASGVRVAHGSADLKPHCKLTLVVREEAAGSRTYVHIATGDHNPTTSRVYTDFGLLTADRRVGEDATNLFDFLTGLSPQREYAHLLVAPANLRERMTEMIERETRHARAGRLARVIAKMNRLTDLQIVAALYEASRAGVEVDLIVRGACMLRPGVSGLSETIRVRSVVGRLLEHSRVFYFSNNGDEEVYIGSADWMRRNLDRRVEVCAPVLDPNLRAHLRDDVLGAYLRDNVKARELTADGAYRHVRVAPGERRFDCQLHFAGEAA